MLSDILSGEKGRFPADAHTELRGQLNRPQNVAHVAKKIAEIKGLSYEEVAKATCRNAKQFYGIG